MFIIERKNLKALCEPKGKIFFYFSFLFFIIIFLFCKKEKWQSTSLPFAGKL